MKNQSLRPSGPIWPEVPPHVRNLYGWQTALLMYGVRP